MTDQAGVSENEWPRGWEEHRLAQLRRMAAWPFAKKLEWLEEAQVLANAILAARRAAKHDQPQREGDHA